MPAYKGNSKIEIHLKQYMYLIQWIWPLWVKRFDEPNHFIWIKDPRYLESGDGSF